MKKTYIKPQSEITEFQTQDVLTSSVLSFSPASRDEVSNGYDGFNYGAGYDD